MVFVHTPPDQSGSNPRAGTLFSTGDEGPSVPPPGQGYGGTIDDYMPMNVLTYIDIEPPGISGAYIDHYMTAQPYVVAIDTNKWVVIGYAWPDIPYVPPGGSFQWSHSFFWQTVTRDPGTGKLTLGPSFTARDPAFTFSMPRDEATEVTQFAQTNMSTDGTMAWTVTGATAFVRSAIFSPDYSSLSFVDFILPDPYQVPLNYFDSAGNRDPNVTTPCGRFTCPPIVLSQNLGFIVMPQVIQSDYSVLYNGCLFTFNPSTGQMLDRWTFPQPPVVYPTDPYGFGWGVRMCMLGDLTIWCTGPDLARIWRFAVHSDTGLIYDEQLLNTQVSFQQFDGLGQYSPAVRFWGSGWVTDEPVRGGQRSNIFITDDNGLKIEGPFPANQVSPHSSGDYAGAACPFNNNNTLWQQVSDGDGQYASNGQPTGNAVYRRFNWRAPQTFGQITYDTGPDLTVPTACCNPDGSYPITQTSEGGFPPWRGTQDHYGNMLYYNPLPPNYNNTGFGTNVLTVW